MMPVPQAIVVQQIGCALLCPLPLRERATPSVQQAQMGEGVSSPEEFFAKKPPHPTESVAMSELPSPAGGEGAATSALLAALRGAK